MIDEGGLAELEVSVCRALDGDDPGLDVLGHGEITLVLGWPAGNPTVAAKRLPLFDTEARAVRYGELITEYVTILGERQIRCVDTEFAVTQSEGGFAGWVLQPMLDPATLGPEAVRRAEAAQGGDAVRDILHRVVGAIAEATDDRVGLDGQLSNWADTDEGLMYFDVTTPLLRDGQGATRLDLGVLTSTLPTVIRPAVARFMAPDLLAQYHSARGVVMDLAANLYKERLQRWVGAVLVAGDERLGERLHPAEVRKHYRSDARTWELLLRMRLADRWFHRRVLRRRYGSLLPEAFER